VAVSRNSRSNSERSSIVNGAAENGYAAVGALRSISSTHGGNCTATVIGAFAVLTAGHCVTEDVAPYRALSQVTFYVGGPSGTAYSAASVAVHPNYGGPNRSDVAVVRFSQRVVGAAAMALASTAPKNAEAIALLGFGLTGPGQGSFGTKRKATNVIDEIGTTLFSSMAGPARAPLRRRLGRTHAGQAQRARRGDRRPFGREWRLHAGLGHPRRRLRHLDQPAALDRRLRRPCRTGPECLSKVCLRLTTGSQVCTQACDSAKPCPNSDRCESLSSGTIKAACAPGTGVAPGKMASPCSTGLDCESFCASPQRAPLPTVRRSASRARTTAQPLQLRAPPERRGWLVCGRRCEEAR